MRDELARLRHRVEELQYHLKDRESSLARYKDQLDRMRLRYGAVLRSTPHGLCMLEPDWSISYANHAMNILLNPMGSLTANLIDIPFDALFSSTEEFEAYRTSAVENLRRMGMDRRELHLQRLDGEHFWCEVSLVRHDPAATAGGFVASLTDVTDRKRTEEELRRLASFPRLLPNPVVEISLQGEVTYLNPEAEERFPDLRDLGVRHPFLENLLQEVNDAGRFGQEFLVREARVGKAWYEQIVHHVEEGRCYRIYSQNITGRKQAEERLRFEALHDTLTGLPNRALFLDRLNHGIVRLKRNKLLRFAVLFLDLDNFKMINDSLGHGTGDHLLLELARRIQQIIRPEDTVARLGGDEFALLLESIQDASAAVQIAQRVQDVIREPVRVGDHEIHVTASVGIAHSRPDRVNALDFLRDADTAMYQAKRDGKNRHAVFDPAMHEAAVHRLTQEVELRRALRQGEFELCFQPVVDITTDRLVGFESLLRWRHPEKGLLEPDLFIRVAEETGLIVPIGQWVLERSCLRIREWRERFALPLVIHVNLSVRQFADPDLEPLVRSILKRSGLPPEALTLEITESVLMEYGPGTGALLASLNKIGIHLCIDDFGTGYSSLAYLKQLPIDSLKIDRTFVSHSTENEENREIIRAVRALARTFQIDLVAEGVETRDHYEYLKSLECHYAQGFYFSPPLEETEAERFLESTSAKP